ncbi:MAG: hypothetical protein AABZ63_04015 [Actinomycetota bacterium]
MPGHVSGFTPEFLAQAQAHWSKRYGRPVSEAEVENIHRNLNGFFEVLLDWRRQDEAKAAEQKALDCSAGTR